MAPHCSSLSWNWDIIYIDASLMGWGITEIIHLSEVMWHKSEIDHINAAELKTIEIGIRTYCSNKHYSDTRFKCDKMTVITYINNKGGIKSDSSNKITCNTCYFCITEKLWTPTAFILEVCDNGADNQSRIFQEATDGTRATYKTLSKSV